MIWKPLELKAVAVPSVLAERFLPRRFVCSRSHLVLALLHHVMFILQRHIWNRTLQQDEQELVLERKQGSCSYNFPDYFGRDCEVFPTKQNTTEMRSNIYVKLESN